MFIIFFLYFSVSLSISVTSALGQSNDSKMIGEMPDIDDPIKKSTVAIVEDSFSGPRQIIASAVIAHDLSTIVTAAHVFEDIKLPLYLDSEVGPLSGYKISEENLIVSGFWKKTREEFPFALPLSTSFDYPLGDLAIIKLDKPLDARFKALPLSERKIEDNEEFTAYGFGWNKPINSNNEGSPSLKQRWAKFYKYEYLSLTNSMQGEIILKPTNVANGVCDADSGGPLIRKDERGILSLVGVLSRNNKAECPGDYAIWTDVSVFSQCIKSAAPKNIPFCLGDIN